MYEPAPAVRSVHAAVIGYSLARAGAAVRVEVADAEGAVVHRFDATGTAGLNRTV
ncbi:MAG: hypothetical protein JWP63_3365 [Candidatus Solibacter sp.]|nr:hypothetical protein [Candidatus Solibacter sp.]